MHTEAKGIVRKLRREGREVEETFFGEGVLFVISALPPGRTLHCGGHSSTHVGRVLEGGVVHLVGDRATLSREGDLYRLPPHTAYDERCDGDRLARIVDIFLLPSHGAHSPGAD